jgi:hypothetical protein
MGWNSSFNTHELQLGRNHTRSSTIYGTVLPQKGDGLFNTITEALGKVAQKARNALPSSDENARELSEGENHAVLSVNGLPGNANYMGPGTKIVKRIMRGDPPRTLSDKVAQAHDLRYQLGIDERVADQKMLSKLDDIQKSKGDSDFNIRMGSLPIRAKIAAEDRGILRKGKFSEKKDPMTTQEEGVLRSKLKSLEQEGYGMGLVGGCKEPMANCPAKRNKRKKEQPLPGEELLNSLAPKRQRRSQAGRGCGQIGRGISGGISNEPYAGEWLQGEWQNALTIPNKQPAIQIGKGIGDEAYAGPWMQGEWTNAMSGSGKNKTKGITSVGLTTEPYGGSWLQGEWQSQVGGTGRSGLRSQGPPEFGSLSQGVVRERRNITNNRRQRDDRRGARAPPPSPAAPLSFFGEAKEREEKEPPRSASRSVSRSASRSVSRSREENLPESGREDRRLLFRPVNWGDAIGPDARLRESTWEIYHAHADRIKAKDPDTLQIRRALGLKTAKGLFDPSDFYERAPIRRGNKRYTSGNRPIPRMELERPGGLARRNAIMSGVDADEWDNMNAAEKRQLLRELTGPIDEDKRNFASRMQHAKIMKQKKFPWLKQFQLEIVHYIIPVLLKVIEANPDGFNDINDVAIAFITILNDYAEDGRLGAEGWRYDDPKLKRVQFESGEKAELPRLKFQDRERRRKSGFHLIDSAKDFSAFSETSKGSGLKLAGQGLKLAGQGITKIVNRIYSKSKNHKDFKRHLGKAVAKHISDVLIGHMKGRGCAVPPGTGQNITDYLEEPMVCRVSSYMCGEKQSYQTGSGFWHSFVEGFKKIGLPILKTAATIAPLII